MLEIKIEHFLDYCKASDASGFRNLVMIMMLGLLGLRMSFKRLQIHLILINICMPIFFAILNRLWIIGQPCMTSVARPLKVTAQISKYLKPSWVKINMKQ